MNVNPGHPMNRRFLVPATASVVLLLALVTLDQDHVAPAKVAEVIGNGTSDHTATHDHDTGSLR